MYLRVLIENAWAGYFVLMFLWDVKYTQIRYGISTRELFLVRNCMSHFIAGGNKC